ncbi:DUF4097 domain-containing protein [Nocardiopsis mangrovi]|uniref:DUF4097 domain-containing protein n=1 Tax=Nocardiopsis mangrovi TaxID=1179818 RepID=A0ABV9E051_9ACTN
MTFTGRGLYASSSKVPRPRRGRRLGWLAIGLVVAVVVLIIGATKAISSVPLSKEPRSDAFAGVRLLSLENQTFGDVTVVGTDGDELTVDRTLDGSPLADPDDEIEQESGALEVEGQCQGPPFGGDCRIDYEIGVPAGTDLEIETVAGDVEISGVEGDISVETFAGAIRLDGVDGSVDVETRTGSISAEGSGDSIAAQSTAGSIDLAGFDARTMEVETTAGRVDIEGAFDTAEVESTVGSVDVRATERFDLLEVESTAGSVDLRVPDGAYQVSGESVAGSRTVEVPTDAGASAVIDASTTAGSLAVRHGD